LQVVDLTVLTYDSTERQRRSAENLAGGIKKLVTCLLSYPKILIAAVNGVARGAGVTLLPYFDLVRILYNMCHFNDVKTFILFL